MEITAMAPLTIALAILALSVVLLVGARRARAIEERLEELVRTDPLGIAASDREVA